MAVTSSDPRPPADAVGKAGVPIRVISLDHASERRRRLGERLDALGVEYAFVPGVDGRRLSEGERQRHSDPARRMRKATGLVRPPTPGELGCSLAHIEAYRALVRDGAPRAAILEDDAEPGPSLPGILAALAERFGPDVPAVVLLGYMERYYARSRRPLVPGFDLCRVQTSVLATGYFLTNAAARVLAEALYPVWLIADEWEAIARFVPVYGLDPYPVRQTPRADDSFIETERAEAERQWRGGAGDDPGGDRGLPVGVKARRFVHRLRRSLHRRWHDVRKQPLDCHRP